MALPNELASQVGFPFQVDNRGRIASPDYDQHVREMIELVLFTSPGERVNRPDFGCGLLQHVFTSASTQEADALAYVVQTALQQWLAEVISVQEVAIVPRDSSFVVEVVYQLRGHREVQRATFEPRGLP